MALYRKPTAAEWEKKFKKQEVLFKASDECAETMNELRKAVGALPSSPLKEAIEFGMFKMYEMSEVYEYGLPSVEDRTLLSLIHKKRDALKLLEILKEQEGATPDSEAPKK